MRTVDALDWLKRWPDPADERVDCEALAACTTTHGHASGPTQPRGGNTHTHLASVVGCSIRVVMLVVVFDNGLAAVFHRKGHLMSNNQQ